MSEAMITRRGGGGGSSMLQSKTVSITGASTNVVPDSGYDGMSSVTVNIAAESQKAAETFTPGTQAQTIAANKWLAGAQTISGDANLVAANIKKGISIFNVAGSYEAALDTNSAILKVVTSTGCSVSVTNGTNTFTQQDADGFVRTGDANVTEHFFVIPTAAFGTFDVTSTHPTYGDNTKTNAVVIGNAGKVYEVLCGGKNIILDGTFGLQSGFLGKLNLSYGEYSERYKRLQSTAANVGLNGNIADIPVGPYSTLRITANGYGQSQEISLEDQDSASLCDFSFGTSQSTKSREITNKYYATANLVIYSPGFETITEIILT